MGREDADVAEEMLGILTVEGIQVLLDAQPVSVHGLSGDQVTVTVRTVARSRMTRLRHAFCSAALWMRRKTRALGSNRSRCACEFWFVWRTRNGIGRDSMIEHERASTPNLANSTRWR